MLSKMQIFHKTLTPAPLVTALIKSCPTYVDLMKH